MVQNGQILVHYSESFIPNYSEVLVHYSECIGNRFITNNFFLSCSFRDRNRTKIVPIIIQNEMKNLGLLLEYVLYTTGFVLCKR